MTNNNITPINYASTALRTGTNLHTNTANSALFQSILQSHQANSAFSIGSVGTKSIIASPLQVSVVDPMSANIPKNWCISDHYQISPDEVLPLLDTVQQEIAGTDFTGMTDIEIYDWIENKYAQAFGKDFMMAFNLGIPDPEGNSSIVGGGYFSQIGSSFESVLHRQFGSTANGRAAYPEINRQRLYGDMTDKEIKDAIRAKYPENKSMTHRDLQLMFSEMRSVGVFTEITGNDTGYFFIEHLVTKFDANGNVIGFLDYYEQRKIYAGILDEPVDFSRMFATINNWAINNKERGDAECSFIREWMEFSAEYLGATLTSGGLLHPDYFALRGMNPGSIAVPDLEEDFMKHIDKHYRKLARIQEERSADKSDMDLEELLSEKDSTRQAI